MLQPFINIIAPGGGEENFNSESPNFKWELQGIKEDGVSGWGHILGLWYLDVYLHFEFGLVSVFN